MYLPAKRLLQTTAHIGGRVTFWKYYAIIQALTLNRLSNKKSQRLLCGSDISRARNMSWFGVTGAICTIFLDEIGELPLDTQVKLLRVLQEQEFEPVGSSRTLRVDVRVIAATNRNLETAVQEGRFRADLYYRLNVFPIRLPPLRERREDIPQLAMFFMSRCAKKFGKRVDRISQSAMDTLMSYAWPGNIRDLQNVIERAAILSQGSTLRIDWELPPDGTDPAPDGPRSSFPADRSASDTEGASGDVPVTLEDVERRHIIKILNQTRGVIEGAKGAASILKLRPSTLRARMKKLRISRASHKAA
jgi:formate hydrogenlyase transcriptional activator